MTREELLRHSFTKGSRLIEIGASYNPIIPKRDGWNTTVIDHADQKTLQEKYRGQTANNIEKVDAVWTGQPLHTLISPKLLGQYDGIIASHVGEHLTDPVGVLNSLDKILKPTGVIVLALPDKRLCFDFFRPVTTTGMLLDAFATGRQRHNPGQVFDNVAYFSTRKGEGAWMRDWSVENGGEPILHHTVARAYAEYQAAQDNTYHDAHGWCFTPTSFQLNIFELHACGVIPWSISRIERAEGVEFYVWLERLSVRLSEAEIEAKRSQLLLQMAREDAADTLVQLSAKPANRSPQSRLTVSAIVPLYNGSSFIRKALQSILDQSYPPIEIIVVDDGSTDDGADVVKAFQAEHPTANILLYNKKNGGQSSARNLGVKYAHGDLVAFLDQDDEWYRTHLEKLSEPFSDPPHGQPLGWVYSNLDESDQNGQIVQHNFLSVVSGNRHPKRDMYSCLANDMFVLPSASVISRTVFNEVGGYDERLSGYEDDDLFLRIFRSGKHNVFLDVALSKWRMHDASASHTPRMRRSRGIDCRKLLEMFPDDPEKGYFVSGNTILPRFYPHAQYEYRRALEMGDPELIAETMNEIRFLLGVAANGNGMHGIMTPARAKRLIRIFDNHSVDSALRSFHRRRRLRRYLLNRVSLPLLKKVVRVLPLYG